MQNNYIKGLLLIPLVTIFVLSFIISDNTFAFYLMLVVTFLHAYLTKGMRFAVSFFAFVMIASGTVEFLNMEYNLLGTYHYVRESDVGLMIGTVPLVIPVTWTVLIYTSIEILDILVQFRENAIFNSGKFSIRYVCYALILSAMVGLIVTAWDFSTDPLAVASGYYSWELSPQEASYMGIPITNFLGWWVDSALVGAAYFLIFEPVVVKPYQKNHANEISSVRQRLGGTLSWVVFVCYFIFFLGVFKLSVTYNLLLCAFTNCFAMGPIVLLSFIRLGFPKNEQMNINRT